MLRPTRHGPVVRIRLARTWFGRSVHDVSVYLVDGVLVDSGPPATAGELLGWLRDEGVTPAALVNTHHHEDHVGADALLHRELGVPVFAPAATVEILARRGRRIPWYRALVWGTPAACAATALGEELGAGDLRLRVIPTPGHAFDHVCLFDPDRRWLFSGDLFVHERVRYLRRIEQVWTHLDSLRRVLALEPELLFCAHAGPVADACGALARKIAWWEEVGGEARRLAERGLSAREITRRLLGREGLFTYLSLGDFSKRNLIRALIALRP
jgi:glyoxylase-like metal-dependent hydrolase (beta-lactamase superfamily II)